MFVRDFVNKQAPAAVACLEARVLITTAHVGAVIPHRNSPAYSTGYFATVETFTRNPIVLFTLSSNSNLFYCLARNF